ncbi:glycoside hydrolase family 66 protein [Dysgonomonas sp. BGC7]|uniref:glycoside hydrolase family 66 protein n=1 Tax=Dysgonomonas sp. BGC7 TaxID=1658008 RepID=UPI000680BB17|nr:glycoside hydrolase family 66 protein [Dysgonomonas sp. BGC7]MBD8387697.1 glycoside hydrolase family 66 protein [Dysgonomonas sp. BGC7]
MRKIYNFFIIGLCLFLLSSCEDYYDTKKDPVTYGDTYLSIDLNTDKAVYKPGETVSFSLKNKPGSNPKVRYSHLGQVLKEENLGGTSWSWTTPNEDYKGYLIDIYEIVDGKEKIYHSIAVDVSSDWKKFPRYGFLSSYGKMTDAQMAKNIDVMNRYHINGVQFYDWMYDHQRPLAGTADNPLASWPDLIGRTNYLSTVKGYIDAAHNKGMKTMFYNLAFGALSNASSDGVKDEWYIYKDANHSEKDNHHLDPPFRSSIYLTNPGNSEWQNYLAQRNKDVYRVFNFDGYHIDQLGNRGTVYDYSGNVVKLEDTYKPFITAMKQENPDKRLVMNAVSQYGQNNIGTSDVDFLYTEVWDESKTYEDLAQVILNNNTYSNNTKSTVLAAYMNYAKSSGYGFVNAPGILLTNAVIFAFGGAHLEVGEHYLANEYFPNSNLQMKSELKKALISYYDFLVAYQNILRDGGNPSAFNVQSSDGKLSINNWPADKGNIAVTGKTFANKDVIHLINFTNANSMEWRDTNGTQQEASPINEAGVKIVVTKTVSRVWVASPDINGGVTQTLDFTQTGNELSLTLPQLKYWDMLVIEY